MALDEVYCRSPPPAPPPPPQQGSQAGLVSRRGTSLYLAGDPPPISNPEPSLTSVVRDGARATHTAVSRQDFLALYEHCSESGLRTRLILRHQAGSYEISISCRLSAPPSDANAPHNVRRRRRRRNRAPATAPPRTAPPSYPAASSLPPSIPRDVPSLTEPASPQAKRTRKAARRRCEAELLREHDSDEDLQLSPLSHCRQATPINPDPALAIPPPLDPPPATDEPDATLTPPPSSSPILCSPPRRSSLHWARHRQPAQLLTIHRHQPLWYYLPCRRHRVCRRFCPRPLPGNRWERGPL
jgi:hypothetical protein